MAAYRSRDAELERESAKKTREIDALKLRFAAFQKALDTLQSDPADADANLKAGQWICFIKGQWDQGLPLLAKGSNQALAELAKQDLATPGDAKQQVALADAWWNLGEKESSANKAAIVGRARHWYQQAVDKTVGLDKARIQKRLQEETALAPADAGKSSGRESIVNVTNLPFVGKSVVEGKPHNIVVNSLDVWDGYKLLPPSIPGAKVKHFFFLHASSEVEINLESRLKGGQVAKRFKACLYLEQTSRAGGSDGIVWTVEAGGKTGMKLLLTTPQTQDMNPVDLPLPLGTTKIVVRSLPGAANNYSHDWGIMANPVVVFSK